MPSKKRKKINSLGKKKNKHGIPALSARDDLYDLFESKGKKSETGASAFAEALDAISSDNLNLAASEKRIEDAGHEAPLKTKLRRHASPQAEIDLHGLRSAAAEILTDNFIQTSKGKGLNAVRIITGKGLHSDGPAVLQDIVEQRLVALKKNNLVATWEWEKKIKQKSGSVVVYLL